MVERIKRKIWRCRERTVSFGLPRVMGILNITPDSFFVASRTLSVESAITRAKKFIQDGATLIDIGGESTRPGATPITPHEERDRILPVLIALRSHFPDLLISIDTRHTSTAAAALTQGADIINDVSGCAPDHGMLSLIAQSGAGYVLTHATGIATAKSELDDPTSCTETVLHDLLAAAHRAEAAGIHPEQIQLDPGLGFAKTHTVSTQLLRDTARFAQHPYTVMIGASRKRFLGALIHDESPERRAAISVSAALWSTQAGANVVRVHDVQETSDALRLFSVLNSHEDLHYV